MNSNRISKQSRWYEISDIIWEQYRLYQLPGVIEAELKNSPTRYDNPAAAKTAIIGQEQRLRESLDQACQKFAKHRTWPSLTSEEKLLLMARLKQAKDFLDLVKRFGDLIPSPDESHSDEQIIEFLLVYFWGQFGRERYLTEICLHL